MGTTTFHRSSHFHGFRYAELTGLPSSARQECGDGSGLPHRRAVDGEARDRQRDDQPVVEQYSVGAAVEFCGRAYGLPAAGRAAGLDGRCAGFLAHGQLQHGPGGVQSRKFAADMRGTQAGQPFYGIFSPGTVTPFAGAAAAWSDAGVIVPWTSWLQTGDTTIIEQNWDAMTKYLDAIAAANPDSLWENEYGAAVRRLAFAGGQDRRAAAGHGLLGMGCDADAPDGAGYRAHGGRREIRGAVRKDSRGISETVCAQRWICGGRGQLVRRSLA